MIDDDVAARWRKPRLTTLATVRSDGSAHQVPVKSMLDGDEVLVLTRLSTVKVRNVAANPRASVAGGAPLSTNLLLHRLMGSTFVETSGPSSR